MYNFLTLYMYNVSYNACTTCTVHIDHILEFDKLHVLSTCTVYAKIN